MSPPLLVRLPNNTLRWYIVDPICTFIFAILVLLTTRVILLDIFNTLMERAPKGATDASAVIGEMASTEGVLDVHDFHVSHHTAVS